MSLGAVTPQFLADTTLHLLSEEERLLPYGIQGFRECDVQFLLWRELLRRYKETSLEKKRTDIVIHDDDKAVIATIELKGPWFAKGGPELIPEYAKAFKKNFEKHFDRMSLGLPGQCYSLWILTGENEGAVKEFFDKFLKHALTAAPDCLVDAANSSLLDLSNSDPRWRVCRMYAVRVFKDSPRTTVV
jgi:hypothetical protein